MNKRIVGATFALAYALSSAAFAQANLVSDGLKPIDFPKGDAAWTVLYTTQLKENKDRDKFAGEQRVKRIDVVRSGKYRRDMVHWQQGGTTQYWWHGPAKTVFFQTEPGAPITKMRSSVIGMRRLDESNFSWVGPETYQGQNELQGEEYDYFEKVVRQTLDDGDSLTYTLRAWIDLETRLPHAWSDGSVLAIYDFDQPLPTGGLIPPPAFKKSIDEYEAYIAPPKRLGQRKNNERTP